MFARTGLCGILLAASGRAAFLAIELVLFVLQTTLLLGGLFGSGAIIVVFTCGHLQLLDTNG